MKIKFAIVIFFVGNTEKIAKSLEIGLKEAGILTVCMNARDVAAADSLNQYDLICLGALTHQTKTEIISSINIAGGIVDYAESNNVNLIVVGTRGLSGFKKLLLGSNAAHVITYAPCPVLVVK